MALIQTRIDSETKKAAESLFSEMGINLPTAIRMFLKASLTANGLPFETSQRRIPLSLQEAVDDSNQMRNLHGPFETAEEAIAYALKE
ncbi:MAG: type II toxin-antitoxin system RelB/DinJ family antitoxin [Holophagaceae bacterium]|nr:type II toxin-antitoxin system RelB/DinJ family antitoxin [Holophagaceae bacterium]